MYKESPNELTAEERAAKQKEIRLQNLARGRENALKKRQALAAL